MAKRTFNPWKVFDFSGIDGYPYKVPLHIHDWLSKFDESYEISAKRHLELIREVDKELSITHEDVCMRLLAMSFQGTTECWFLNLTTNSISGYSMFEQKFLEEWGNESNDMELLNQTSPSDPMAEIFTDINVFLIA